MPGLLDELEEYTQAEGLDGVNPALRSSVSLGLKKNPDEEIKIRERAKEANLPVISYGGAASAARNAEVTGIISKMGDSPVTKRFMSNRANAEIAHDDVDNLVVIEKEGSLFGGIKKFLNLFKDNIEEATGAIKGAFDKGRITHQLGKAGHEQSAAKPEVRADIQEQIDSLRKTMDSLGVSDEGFLGFLTSAAEIVGQQFETFTQPEASVRVAAGAASGASLGLVGGILAPVTVTAGTGIGIVAGLTSHFAMDSFIQEGGHSYLELRNSGVSHDTARSIATGVGIINAGLELAGAKIVSTPFKKIIREKIRRGVQDVVKRKTVKQAIGGFVKNYTAAVAGETFTEVLQEVTNIAAESIAKEFEGVGEETSYDEIVNRLEEIAVKTFKGMAVLSLPGATSNYVADRGRAKAANERKEGAKKIADLVSDSALAKRTPEVMAEFMQEALDVDAVEMPVEQFDLLTIDLGVEAADILSNDTLRRIYSEAHELGGDVRLPANFIYSLMAGENRTSYDKYQDHFRWGEGEMTAAEAVEFDNQDEIIFDEVFVSAKAEVDEALAIEDGELVTEESEVEIQESDNTVEKMGYSFELNTAIDSLGLQALFRTADEAGMTPKQYEIYQTTLHRAATKSNRRKEVAETKRKQKQVAKVIEDQKEELRPIVKESLGQEPVYAAMRGLGFDKLDPGSLVEVFGEQQGKVAIGELRKAGVKVAAVNDSFGIHIDDWADLYGFDSGDIMVNAMRDAISETQEVERRVEIEVRDQNPELFSMQAELEENITALLHDDSERVIKAEVDALTDDKKEGKVKLSHVRKVAKNVMKEHQIRDISVNKYMANAKKHGREAGKFLRKGDRAGAKEAKVKQLLNVEFVKEAQANIDTVKRGHKYLSRFAKSKKKFPSLAPGYLDAIRDITNEFSLSPELSESKREKLETFVTKAQADGATFEFPKRLLEADKRNYKDFTLHEYELVLQKVKEIYHNGIESQKALDQDRKNLIGTRVDDLVNAVVGQARIPKKTLEAKTKGQKVKQAFEEINLLMLNKDSVLRNLDNFEELGPAYQAIKRSIDQSVTNGYKVETNVGLNNRQKNIAQELLSLYKIFTKKESNTLSKADIRIPGFDYPMSRNTQLSLLLNIGNEENRQALVEGEQVTDTQLESLIEHSSKRDMDFVQGIWDYLDSFWPEIESANERRRGFKPEKVVGTAIQTKWGAYKGGYYPLRYDGENAVNDSAAENIEGSVNEIRYGRAISSHTKHDHTEQRVGSQGLPVLLDLFVLQSHLDQVAYDLELGDAVNETYAVLYDKRTKEAFRNADDIAKWRALDLWLGDTITGEMHGNGPVERSLRWLRAGFTISKLGWNVAVAAIQPIGILQASVLVGHKQTLKGLKMMLSMPWVGENSSFKFAESQSEVMKQRSETFNKDIADASRLISNSWIKRVTPEGSTEFITNSFFYGIIKMQKLVDTWVWLAAKDKGMTTFKNDENQAIEYADRMVIRTQASGNFQERTSLERGTITSKVRQTELVRTFTALISYFMAKTNVAYERTKKTNFRNPGQVVGWATDMALLYVVEAALVGLLRGAWPDAEEEDDYGKAVALNLAKEGLNTLFAGVPMVREFASEAQGFRGGGVFSSFIADVGKVTTQISQGEIDSALIRSANNIGGTLFKYPSSQINKFGKLLELQAEGEDVEWVEWIMGPKFNRYR